MIEKINLNKIQTSHYASESKVATRDTVYMIGIGGIGMSALARYFISKNIKVIGSDRVRSKIIEDLEKLGIKIYDQNIVSDINVDDNIDLVVMTEAIPKDNADYVRARELNIDIRLYAQILGLISDEYETIAVCGTHGKTTTTGLTLSMMNHANLDHVGIVGSLLKSGSNFVNNINKNSIKDIENNKYFIVEACEYRRSFLNLKPKYLIITNIDSDHLDYYKDLDDIKDAFIRLCKNVREGGCIIYHGLDANSKDVINSYKAKNKENKINLIDADEMYPNINLKLKLLGKHNVENAKLVYALGNIFNINDEVIREGLNNFEGTWRRCEYKGVTSNGAIVIDDYAHHPAEILATLEGVRSKYPTHNVVSVFQPHLHSRTYNFLDDFVKALSLFDKVYLLPIYRARSEEDYGVSSEVLAEKLNKKNPPSLTATARQDHKATAVTFENVHDYLKDYTEDTVILTLGAGDNNIVADKLVKI